MFRASNYLKIFNVIVVVAVFSACTIRRDFLYEPEVVDGMPKTSLRIAVMPFVDKRQSINQGSPYYAYIPLMPTSAKVVDSPQSDTDRRSGKYFFPDLIAYGLALDLSKNRAGSVVHFAPQATDDYDIVIRGELLSMAETDRKITYGLSVAAELLNIVGVPTKSNSSDFKAEYRVEQPNGTVFFKQIYEDSWTTVNDVPIMEGINDNIRDTNTEFLKALKPVLLKLDTKDAELRRIHRFYAQLDPELKQFDAERRRSIKADRSNTRFFRRLTGEMKKREKWLEIYRAGEWKILTRQQEQIYELQAKRLDAINRIRQQRRAIIAQQEDLKQRKSRAQSRALTSALVAGLVPAMQGAQAAGGTWRSENTLAAFRDTSAALSQIPQDLDAPVPDLSSYLRELNTSFGGLASAGGNPFKNIRGASLSEIRTNFLKQYRKLITPMSRLRS